MARILISEPHPDLRVLIEAVVRRTGNEPVGQGELTSDDVPEAMILEPASADGLAAAAGYAAGSRVSRSSAQASTHPVTRAAPSIRWPT